MLFRKDIIVILSANTLKKIGDLCFSEASLGANYSRECLYTTNLKGDDWYWKAIRAFTRENIHPMKSISNKGLHI